MTPVSLRSAACAAALLLPGAAPGFAVQADSAPGAARHGGLAALEALGLAGDPTISWDALDVEGDRFRITGYQETSELGVFTAETVTIDNLRMTPGGVLFDTYDMRNTTFDGTKTHEVVSLDRALIRGPSRSLIEAMARGGLSSDADADMFVFELGELTAEHWELEGLRIVAPGDPQAGLPEMSFEVERLVASNPDLDEYADLGLSDFRLLIGTADGFPPVDVRLARADGAGILITSFFNGFGTEAFDPALALTKTMDRFELSGLEVTAGGLQIAMPSFSGTMEELSGGALRTAMAMPALSIDFDPAADEMSAEAAASLAMLGYERLDLSFDGAYVYDPAEDRMYTDGPNLMTLVDGGTLGVRYDVTGFSAYMTAVSELQAEIIAAGEAGDELAVEDDFMVDVFSALALNSLSYSIEDAGLLERSLNLFANQSGVDPATARAQAVGMVTLFSMGVGEVMTPALAAQMSEAVTGFIQNGGTLSVAIEPASPIRFSDMLNAEIGFDAEAAGWSFTHEAP